MVYLPEPLVFLILRYRYKMQIKTRFTKKEHVDSGLALLLITLMTGLLLDSHLAFRLAIAEILVVLLVPAVVYPFTFIWLNISEWMGKLMSKILLTIIFFGLVWPVAVFRRIWGKDTLRLKQFKKDNNSVFTERNLTFGKSDLMMPY